LKFFFSHADTKETVDILVDQMAGIINWHAINSNFKKWILIFQKILYFWSIRWSPLAV
jgi:hypothetical protein